MNITKNWFYKNIQAEGIFIWDNLVVAIFDSSNMLKSINVWENSKVEYFSFFSDPFDYEKDIKMNSSNSICVINSLIYSSNSKLDVKIYAESNASDTKIKAHILSFIWENWDIKIDWTIKINKNLSKVSWNLKEENIYLWTSWKVTWLPVLMIESNDVEASHSCNIEKISDEKLFYLRSRGIWKENALRIMIEAKVKDLYRCLFAYDNNFEQEILDWILDIIWN